MSNDHYVPQFVLREHSEKKGKIHCVWVYDKKNKKKFRSNIKNVLVEKNYNEVEVGKGLYTSFEGHMAYIENLAAPIFKKIRRLRNLSSITNLEYSILLVFIIIQLLRTKKTREFFSKSDQIILDKIKEMGGDVYKINNYKPIGNENELKKLSLTFMFKNLNELTQHLVNKEMFLLSVPKNFHYYISDHPIVMSNQNDFGHLGNLGLGVKGIEIYFPFAFDLCLVLYCSSIKNKIMKQMNLVEKTIINLNSLAMIGAAPLNDKQNEDLKALKKQFSNQKELVFAMKNKSCLEANRENIMFCNSLQAYQSERYVVSKKNDFDFVEKIIDNLP